MMETAFEHFDKTKGEETCSPSRGENTTDHFEQIVKLWQQQDERLQRIERVQRESVSRLLRKNINGTHRHFMIVGGSATLMGGAALLLVLTQAGKFFGSWQMALAYLIFVGTYGFIVCWYAVWMLRLHRNAALSAPTISVMKTLDRWHLAQKRSLLWITGVATPICIASGLPVAAHWFGHSFHYSDLQYLDPWRIAIAALIYIIAVGSTLRDMRLTRTLKDNLKQYDELFNE